MALPAFFDPIVNAPRWQKFALGIFGLVILGAGSYFLVLSPLEIKVNALRAQRSTVHRELLEARAAAADLARVRLEIAALQARLATMKERLPGEKAVPALVVVGLATSLTACSGGSASQAPSASAPTAPMPAAPTASQPVASATASEPQAPPPVKYQAKGRRDPFENLEVREGASGPTLASAKLTGIVQGSRGPLALVETSDGLGYILKPGDTLGDGRLLEIGSDSVVFRIAVRTGSTTDRVVLKLPGD